MTDWALLLSKIIEVVEKLLHAKKQKDRQREADEAAHDPAGAFADHFDGRVRDLPQDAGKASKAPD